MSKEFVPYEIALALKELGFNETCFGYWNRDPYLPKLTFNLVKPFAHEWCVPTPLKQQAFRFFREKHGLFGFVDMTIDFDSFSPTINAKGKSHVRFNPCEYSTYEEAELACLIKLIQLAKETNIK